jgi:hypothetical protein
MKIAAKQFNCTKKGSALTKFFDWCTEVDSGSPNGSADIKNKGWKDSRIEVESPGESGGRLRIVWSKRFSLFEKSWNRIERDVPLFLVLERKSFIGNLNKERFTMYPPSLPLPKFSLDMGEHEKGRLQETSLAVINRIHLQRQRKWEICIKQTS